MAWDEESQQAKSQGDNAHLWWEPWSRILCSPRTFVAWHYEMRWEAPVAFSTSQVFVSQLSRSYALLAALRVCIVFVTHSKIDNLQRCED